MKKIWSLIAAMGIIFSLQAQGIKFGVKAGANMHKIDGVSFKDQYNLGYYAGGVVEIYAGKKFFIAPELLFSQSELKTSTEFADIYNDIDIATVTSLKLSQLSIPITLNYKVANIFSISGGPVFSINRNKEESFLRNVGKAFTDGDIGLAAGASIHVSKLRINGRYIVGLKDQNNLEGPDKWKSQQIQLGVGFVF